MENKLQMEICTLSTSFQFLVKILWYLASAFAQLKTVLPHHESHSILECRTRTKSAMTSIFP